ncbi:MAG: ATP-dependent DNA helicase RecG [Candidatus Peribacteraceae bacterium]|nr:ATP-dependent DNA helicase RecG [Candidatus Peribacteraceae bacterium]
MQLSAPLKDVLRTTPQHWQALEGMGLKTVEDLLLYLPRSHEDLSQIQTLATAALDAKVTLRGTVENIKLIRTRRGKSLVTARFIDTDGATAEIVWFNQPHVKRMLREGGEVVLTGKLIEEGYKLKMQSPQFEQAGMRPLVHAGRLVPIYPQHDIISTKWLREKMVLVKEAIEQLSESLPEPVIREEGLLSRKDAIRALHFPEKPEEVERAMQRIAFEEMYRIQMAALERKRDWQGARQERLKIPMDAAFMKLFFQSLRFTPTGSQKIAIYEILRDMEKPEPMSRLLEGDVGSGKTLVATAVIAHVLYHGGQCALMVPTEVLARQHVETMGRLLLKFHTFLEQERAVGKSVPARRLPPVVALLTGSIPPQEALKIKRNLSEGFIDLLVGTHALIQDSVSFRDLKFVVVDEQHRFGVEQRQRLQEKGSPHFLAMTATPIPRTLALTAFGHHDLSVLLEKPGHRQKIHTKVVAPGERVVVERFIDHEIGQGRQVFVICPLIEESGNEEMLDVKSVKAEEKRLKESFLHRRIAILHGKMAAQEKTEVMRLFKERAFDLLISTSVIEVGIDVPNATVMLIEGAERFGLAQLHQFRGRVGRGEHQSHCFLFTTTPEQARSVRLKAMEEHDSGFLLAEIDLKIRGPGELFGTRQSGVAFDRLIGSFWSPEFIVRARRAAEKALAV